MFEGSEGGVILSSSGLAELMMVMVDLRAVKMSNLTRAD